MADLVAAVEQQKTKVWLALRDDLSLMQGPRAYDGSPTWTLYDPVVHRYYRIGWLEFECLHRWGLGSAEAIAAAINEETPIDAETGDVEQFGFFLYKNQLVKPSSKEFSKLFAQTRARAKRSFWAWLLHNYLFIRIPLVKPDRYLRKTLPVMKYFFRRGFIALLLALIGLAVYLVSQQWSEFSHSFVYNFTAEGVLATLGMMSLSKVIHELGHAAAASHFGCRVPAMGVALMMGMPVLWTDVTDSWRLANRKDRLVIDSAGMIAELTLAAIATLLWSILPDGEFRSGMYFLASSAWLITLTINLNPFMRFDGYYILSDILDTPNMQDRSFALALWQLRESLFGFGISAPEIFPKHRQRFMIGYAYSVWLYRLILFTGIAWAVYYFFFKALGLALFAVEIGWFIIRPIYKEVDVWRVLLAERKTPLHFRPAWLMPLLVLALLLVPWQTHILVPGLMRSEAEYTFYSIEAAQVREVFVKEGGFVQPGQTLLTLGSPDVDYKITAARLKLAELTEKLTSQSLDSKLARNNPVDFEMLQSTRAELQGLLDIKKKLTVQATFSGYVRDLPDWLRPGEWLAKDEPLGAVESPAIAIVAYTEEADLNKLKIGGEGRFYPEGGDLAPIEVKIIAVDRTGTRELNIEELASRYGGEVAVRPDEDNRLIPEQGLYRVLLQTARQGMPFQSNVRGRLALATQPESIAAWLIRVFLVELVKESGW